MFNVPTIFLISAGAALVSIIGFSLVHRLVKPIDLNECLASSLFACRDSLILPLDYPVISAQI